MLLLEISEITSVSFTKFCQHASILTVSQWNAFCKLVINHFKRQIESSSERQRKIARISLQNKHQSFRCLSDALSRVAQHLWGRRHHSGSFCTSPLVFAHNSSRPIYVKRRILSTTSYVLFRRISVTVHSAAELTVHRSCCRCCLFSRTWQHIMCGTLVQHDTSLLLNLNFLSF